MHYLQTETGFTVAMICLVFGMGDLCIGWLWLRRQNAQRELLAHPSVRRMVPWLITFDVVLVAIGLFGLYLKKYAVGQGILPPIS